jgi:hypothetical protein
LAFVEASPSTTCPSLCDETSQRIKWCLCITPLEPFFRDKARCEGIPTPVPTAGTPSDVKPSLVHKGFAAVLPSRYAPEYGRFLPLTRLTSCAWPIGHARPKNLLVADATNGFTHGRFYG